MNKKIVLSVLGFATLLGLFAGGNFNIANADSAVSNGCTSETLYGTVTPNGATTSAWFEWGPTTAMQYSTPVQTFNTTSSFSQTISPLPENTTFYWRAMASNINGTATGNILSFTTSSCTQTISAPVVTITADQINLTFNGSTTIRWSSTNNPTSCVASGGMNSWSGTRNTFGSFFTGTLTGDTTFSISCSNGGGTGNNSVTVSVGSQVLAPTVTLWADQTNVAYASATTLHWTSTNSPQTCSGSGGNGVPGWTGMQNVTGSFNTGVLTNTSTFTLSCTNTGGTGSSSVTISVAGQPAQTCQDTTAINFGGALPCRYPAQTCQDTAALNFGGALPCRYPVQTCQDTTAINFGGTLPCRYPTPVQTCQDTTALNFGGTLPCRYMSPPTVSITADQTNVAYNGGTVIRWSSNNTISCNASGGINGWSGLRNTSGSFFTGTLTNSVAFNITCSNSSGNSVSDSVIVNVGSQPVQTCQDTTAINFGGALPCRYPVQTCQDPSATNYGGALPCHYPTQTCQDVNATNYGGVLPCRYPTQTCQDINATNYGGALPCRYQNLQPTVNIYADNTNVNFNDSTIIRWSSTNASSCFANGGTNGWSGIRNTSGSFYTGILTSTMTYNITCTNNQGGGTGNGSVTIYVNNNNNNCYNNNNYNNNCTQPNVTISADQTNLPYNGSTIIRWYPSNANYCTGSGGSNGWAGNQSANYGGTFNTGSLTSTTTYYINCTNNSGSNSAQVTVYVNNYNNNTNYYTPPAASAPTAVTTSATQLSNTSAQLNSLIFSGGSNTNTWFEWGSTTDLGNSTNQSSIGSVTSTTHSDTITGLSTGVTYYYRAAAENSSIRNYGTTLSFTMQNQGVVAGTSTTIVRPTTIINQGGTQSLVMLTIDGGAENILPLERRNYHLVWKNISSQTLNKVVLRVMLPKSMTFENSTRGSFSNDDNTLTLDINTLSPGESSDLFLLADAGQNIKQGELVVVVANLVYTDQANAQGNVIAYTTQRGDLSGSVLGANAFGAGFLPSTFLGWLLLLILLLIILLLSRYLYNQFKGPQPPVVIEH